MEERYVIAHDVGTGGDKAVLMSTDGEIIRSEFKEYEVSYPKPGWAEQDPEMWWRAIVETTRALIRKSKVPPRNVVGIGFDAQMVTMAPVDKKGNALRPAMLWLDTRAGKQSKEFSEKFSLEKLVFELGVMPVITTKDVIPKILWIKENEPEVFRKAHKFLKAKDCVVYKCTGKFCTDWTSAQLFGMFHDDKKVWVEELLDAIGLKADQLPEPMKTTDIVGYLTKNASKALNLPQNTPVVCGCGDIPATGIGSGAIKVGKVHIYIGSSAWAGVHVKELIFTDGMGSIFSADPDRRILVGEMESAASCLRWFRDEMAYKEKMEAARAKRRIYEILDEEAEKVNPGSDKLIFTPWMHGERVPIESHTVGGAFINLRFVHTKRHLIRAIMEGVAYNMRWTLEKIEGAGFNFESLNACGGGARSPFWLQVFSDVTGKAVKQIRSPQDVAAIGTGMVTLVGLGILKDFESEEKLIPIQREFHPRDENKKTYDDLYEIFKGIYKRIGDLYDTLYKL